MADVNLLEPIHLLLSREELLFVLHTFGLATMPGIEDDPTGPLIAEQQAVALRVAERALRARQLAWVQADDQLALHRNLLAAVGACAYAEKAIFVYHWSAGQTLPTPCFAHIRGPDCVLHRRPADVLHLFSLLPSLARLTQQLLAACEYTTPAATLPATELRIPGEAFVQIREQVDGGSVQRALDLLTRYAPARAAAQALVDTLRDGLRVSNLQLLNQHNGAVERQDYLLLQNAQYTWLGTTAGNNGATTVTLKPAIGADVETLLTAWLT
ncbi:MAG: hypothetical protein R3E79_04140 [Caldilineaceae bacterium]